MFLPVYITGLLLCAAVTGLAHGEARFAGTANSQEVESVDQAKELEAKVRALCSNVLGSVVGLVVIDGAALGESPQSGISGSGVVISPEGWILTAGHVCGKPGQMVDVHFPDGTTRKGVTAGLRWEGQEDCGLVKFDPAGGPPAAARPVGESSQAKIGDWVVAFGHTFGVYKGHPPAARIGRIRNIRGNVLDMDAPISVGDSGGPLFNLKGEVIGVVASGGDEPWIGSSTAVDLAKKLMPGMMTGERTGKEALAAPGTTFTVAVGAQPPSREGNESREDPAMLAALSPLTEITGESTVGVMVQGAEVGLGLAVKGGFVLAKASDVGTTADDVGVTLPDGLLIPCTRMAVDNVLDLVLLWPGENSELPPIKFEAETEVEIGSILVSPGRTMEPMAVGIMGMQPLQTGRYDILSPYMGVVTDAAPSGLEGVLLRGVMEGSAAFKAGIIPGDMVTSVGALEVKSQAEFGDAIRTHSIGEVVEFKLIRDGEPVALLVRMEPRTMEESPAASTPAVPASRRSSGFGKVIQHDSILGAAEMGGALIDLDGRVIGMNIARVDRTKTYALPADVLTEAIDRLVAEADPSKPLPLRQEVDAALPVVEVDGVITLSADTAEVAGPMIRYEFDQHLKAGVIGRWARKNDRVRWCAVADRAGRFAVVLTEACSQRGGGTFSIKVAPGDGGLEGSVATTSGDTTCTSIDLGVIDLPAGRSFLEVIPKSIRGESLMRLRSLVLKRIG